MITAGDGIELLKIARKSLEERLIKGREYLPSGLPSSVCAGPQGVFVTLYTFPRKSLRGCIGRIESDWPLGETVARMAVESAIHDPRFDPVTAGELSSLIINVSALSPLIAARNEKDIVIGRHGVVLRAQGRTGVFLPEVAVEYGWDSIQLLDRLCGEKMGLSKMAWREPGSQINVFESSRFAEESPGVPGRGIAG